MEALARFLCDVRWSGTIVEGGMGPGTPAMTALGRGSHERIQDGRWIVGDYEQEQCHADVMRGVIDGDRLVFETIGDPPVRLRLVWDLTDPKAMTWRNEMSAGGAPWSLVEEYDLTPL